MKPGFVYALKRKSKIVVKVKTGKTPNPRIERE
jgi:hypothetical protein